MRFNHGDIEEIHKFWKAVNYCLKELRLKELVRHPIS